MTVTFHSKIQIYTKNIELWCLTSNPYILLMFAIYTILTCPSFLEVFHVVILGERHVEILWLSESEAPLILGPPGKILLITKEDAVQKTHQTAGVLPDFTTQLLESQVLIMSNLSNICCVGVFCFTEVIFFSYF